MLIYILHLEQNFGVHVYVCVCFLLHNIVLRQCLSLNPELVTQLDWPVS